jgi:hypothetical protein
MGRRITLAWLIAVIAGVFMVVPAVASAQEQGSTQADPALEDAATVEDTGAEDPAAETPPAEPAAEAPAVPAEPTEAADDAAAAEDAAPADAGFDGAVATTKAAPPEATSAPAPAPAATPADVPAVEASATKAPGNDGGDGGTVAGRSLADGGGKLNATERSSIAKPGVCSAARGGVGDEHAGFPTDGSCVKSQFEGGLPATEDGTSDLTINAPTGTISFDIWEDPDGTVNFTVLSGGPFTGAFYVKGGPVHNQCQFTNVSGGSCSTAINPSNGNPYGFSHLDVCVGENPPPPPPPDVPTDEPETPGTGPGPDETQVQNEQQEGDTPDNNVRDELEERELPQGVAPGVPSAVTPAPEEGLPFTGLDTGWLALMSIVLVGSGVALRRKVS